MKNKIFLSPFLLLILPLAFLLLISFQFCYSSTNKVTDFILTTEFNKYKFIPGESVIISGEATLTKETNTTIIHEPYIGKLDVFIWKRSNASSPERNPADLLIFKKTLFINGNFSNFTFESPHIGNYVIYYYPSYIPSLPGLGGNDENRDLFEVVSPVYTTWGLSFAIAIFFVIVLVLLIMFSTKNIQFTTFEMYRFISISGITLPIIFGLIFIDSEWGRNSPISIIKFIDDTNEEQLRNQWIINIGGIKFNNYQSGIFIPVFVLIFGLAGGYLRYLHRTILQKDNIEHLTYIDEYLFNWNEIPGNLQETNKLKQYLSTAYTINWLNNREFEKVSDLELKIYSEDKAHNISLHLNKIEEKIIIKIDDIIKGILVANRLKEDILVYKRSDKKNWLFYQSLGDLTILVMAPLLAIASWFILTTAGVYDKYVVATVSFAIGLITENIINRLIGFSELAFKGK